MKTEEHRTGHPDLEALRRSGPSLQAERPARALLPRLTLLLLCIGGLAAIFAVLKPLFFPPREVALSTIRLSTEQRARRSASSVQAAGWVEADPYPTTIRPLVSGVVEEMEVVEGTRLEKGKTIIAVLRNLELENAFDLARSEVALRTAEHAHAESTLAVARSLLEQNIEARTNLAAIRGERETARAEVERVKASEHLATAGLERARVDLQAQLDLKAAGRTAPTALATAEAQVKEAEARVEASRFDGQRARADLERTEALVLLAEESVAAPRALEGAVTDAASNVIHIHALLEKARTAEAVAQRNVDNLTIRAPADGLVLRLEAAPGASAGPAGAFKGEREGTGSTGGLNRMTGALCTMYDPNRLQVRVDLPYADVPGIGAGTEAEVEAKAVPGRVFQGVVSRLVSEADITQAKLQVKVRLLDPDARLRPEMICTARFLVKAPASEPSAEGAVRGPARLLVPSRALRGESLFLFDPTHGGHARRIVVKVFDIGPEWAEVEGDLGLSSKVILDDVSDGERVKGVQ